MIYNNNLNSFAIILNKSLVFNKQYTINHFFLTNNFLIFNNFFNFISYFNNTNVLLLLNVKKNWNLNLNIKKNFLPFIKLFNNYRNFLYYKSFIFKFGFKFLKYFKNLNLKSFNNFKNYNIFNQKIKIFKPFFFNNYINVLKKNWNFLIGSGLSPYYWNLYSKKNFFRKNLITNFVRNNYYFTKNFKKTTPFLRKNFFKKFIINNFFYIRRYKINYSLLTNFLKIQTSFNYKNKYDWFFSRPYLFLNNYKIKRKSLIYPNLFFLKIYRNYLRVFSNIKKINYKSKLKKSNDFFFKNNYYSSNINTSSHPIYFYKNCYRLFSFLNIFNYKINFNNSMFLSKKKIIKKYLKFNWTQFFNYKTKIIKRNKILSLLNILNYLKRDGEKKSYFFYKKTTRVSRKLKKFFLISRIDNFFKSPKKLDFVFFRKKNSYTNSIKNIKNINNSYNYFNLVNDNLIFKFYKFKKTPLLLKNNIIFTYKKKFNNLSYLNSNILKIFNKPFYISKERNNFILNKYGFLFINENSNNYISNRNSIYTLKKLMYSFSYKNEIQKYILKRYTKKYFMTNLYNFNSNYVKTNLNIKKIKFDSDFSFFNNFFKKKSKSSLFIDNKLYYLKNWTYFKTQNTFAKNTFRDESNFNIRRVRFKPGYMSIWREVRNVLKTSLSLNFRYQYRLTKYLSKYNKFIKFKTFLFSEMKLINVLIRSRILFDYSLCHLFIKNNLIYLNGRICSNYNFQLFTGDFIQLIINIKYYIINKWFLNLITKKKIN